MQKGRSRNDILLEYIEHPGFNIMYGDVLDREIKKTIGKIVSPTIEDDERLYSKAQLERMLLKILENLRDQPKYFFAELSLNNNELLSDIGELKREELKNMS